MRSSSILSTECTPDSVDMMTNPMGFGMMTVKGDALEEFTARSDWSRSQHRLILCITDRLSVRANERRRSILMDRSVAAGT